MIQINGNILVFTDQHFGIKGNAPSRQKVSAMAIKNILLAIDKHNVENIIFCGDYFHQRNALTVDTLNIAYRCLQALAKKCNVYMILGNHDLFNKNSTDVNSINIFRDNGNIHVIDSATEIELNKQKALFVPWLADLSTFKKEQFKFMFGHFEVSSKFLIADYAQEHSRSIEATNEIVNSIDSNDILESSGNQSNIAEKYLGSFLDLVSKDGTIFAGHIHQHKEMLVKGRKFIFVGSPYEQNLGDIGSKCGYYIIDKNNNYSFFECQGLPKHIKFICSKIMKDGIDKFDFSNAKRNIVQKVYDIDISMEDDLKINEKISSYCPYEELLPDYQVALDFTKNVDDNKKQEHLVKMLNKSKLDYIDSYINQLDENVLTDEGIDKTKLFNIMKKYYDKVVGEDEQ